MILNVHTIEGICECLTRFETGLIGFSDIDLSNVRTFREFYEAYVEDNASMIHQYVSAFITTYATGVLLKVNQVKMMSLYGMVMAVFQD
jgi:hypothetical protein